MMGMIRLGWILGCCITLNFSLQAQTTQNNMWEFYEELSDAVEVQVSDNNYTLVNFEDWNTAFFKTDVTQSMHPKAKWKLMFEQYEYTEEVLGQPLPTRNHTKDKYGKLSINNRAIYTSTELSENLLIDQTFFSNDLVSDYPRIYERENELNGEWVPYQSNNLLILRYVHSYPNGNITSFYKEILLYFERIE
jgi:hypothetical protein